MRSAAENMSAAPPSTSMRMTSHAHSVTAPGLSMTAPPAMTTAMPQAMMQTMTARPWRTTRDTQPDSSPPRTAPAAMEE